LCAASGEIKKFNGMEDRLAIPLGDIPAISIEVNPGVWSILREGGGDFIAADFLKKSGTRCAFRPLKKYTARV
jgi:hypothetical protein